MINFTFTCYSRKKTILKCYCITFILLLALQSAFAQNEARMVFNFNHGWELHRLDSASTWKEEKAIRTGSSFQSQFNEEQISNNNEVADSIIKIEINEALQGFLSEYSSIQNSQWEKVSLPCPAKYEQALNPGPNQFAGICYYRKSFTIPTSHKSSRLSILFEGAMQTASVWVNGKFVLQHRGGYTPFVVQLNDYINRESTNEIIVRLDNRDDRNTPPGKPLEKLGFLYWSGIYRDAWLIATNPVHITNAVEVGKVAGGGVFVRYENVSDRSADVLIKTQVKNSLPAGVGELVIKQIISDKAGKRIKEIMSNRLYINAGKDTSIEQNTVIQNPHLWCPDTAYLYNLITEVWQNNQLLDKYPQRIGIRTLLFSRKEGFKINGRPLRINGTSRHQDYPFIGNALSNAAQYRDLKKIKESGMNFIRLSHYPQDPSIYEICDSLGLMVADPIPGWQFFNNNALFKERVYQDIRDMVRRDRNHPSVIMWEASLNESYPPGSFRIKSAAVAHEEYPGDQMYTSGDTYGAKNTNWDVAYNSWEDPFGRPQDIQPKTAGFVREYGDYEFGGAYSTTRINRSNGEKALLQNAWNFQWEHNLLRSPAYYPWTVGDANWAFFDGFEAFTKGTSDWGIMDIYRLPKFSFYFFKSQVDAVQNGPVLYIANWWTKQDTLSKVIVYSNCEEIALFNNGKLIKRQHPDDGPDSDYGDWEKGGNSFDGGNGKHLTHPPFTFNDIKWKEGELKAIGFIKGKKVTEDIIRTPGKAYKLSLTANTEEMSLVADNADVIFVYATITDKNGTILCLDNEAGISFTIEGNGKIVSPAFVKVRGGIASVLVKSNNHPGNIIIRASGKNIQPAFIRIHSIKEH